MSAYPLFTDFQVSGSPTKTVLAPPSMGPPSIYQLAEIINLIQLKVSLVGDY